MRIGLIALQQELTPPSGYGAVGRIVADLAVALRRRVEVLPVVAEGSGVCVPRLEVPYVGRRGTPVPERLTRYVEVLSRCDVIHNHDPSMTGWLEEHAGAPVVTTLHTNHLPRTCAASRFAYLSEFQAGHLGRVRFAGWSRPIATPPVLPCPDSDRSKDLVVLGQIRPEKGIVEACRLAVAAGRRLVLAGPLPRRYATWFAHEVGRYLACGQFVYVGEVRDPVRLRLLRSSAALVFLSWPPEPLGLVMLEAMAVGTPVLALDRGACGELVEDGRSGFVRDNVDALAAAVDELAGLDPDLVRKSVERFNPDLVVEEHLCLYSRVAATESAS